MSEFSYIPLFKEISQWLLQYENKQDELIEILSDVGIDNGLQDELISGVKVPLKQIDPFSFYSLFMKYGIKKREVLFSKLIENLQFNSATPTDFYGVPSSQALKVWLFPYAHDRTPDMIETLWSLFKQGHNDAIKSETFDSALAIPNTAMAKLTECLFYAFPDKYFPIDAQTKPWLNKHGIEIPSNWESYEECLSQVNRQSDNAFSEISHEAWLENQSDVKEDGSEYEVKKTLNEDNQYAEVIDPEITSNLNQILFGPPGTGKTFSTTAIAVKIADAEWYEEQYYKYGPDWSGFFDAVKKRYDELVNQKRIVFTTFHQSFAYEDFIEGIRASTDAKTGALRYEVEDGVFKKICDSADVRVTLKSSDSIDLRGKRIWKMSLGNTLGDDDDIYQECMENNYALLGYGRDVNYSGCNTRKEVREKIESETGEKQKDNSYTLTSVHNFKNIIKTGDIIVVSDGNQKFRAIGEFIGEYQFLETEERVGYQQLRSVKWLRQYEPSLPIEQLFKKSLSQMTLYELREQTVDHEKLTQLLEPQEVREQEAKPHVLIVDEINRGNISRIFGELITLLEPDKRKGRYDARCVTLPYSKKIFSVPNNVYVIGTMNTADKSLAQLDLALRRRFSFIETPPNPGLLKDINIHDVNMAELLSVINQRIEVLLDKDHLIGHSYFWSLRIKATAKEMEQKLAVVFKQNIIPLLQEYFFDDWERIGWVLNDPQKKPTDRFVQQGGHKTVDHLFSGVVAEQISDRRYFVNDDAYKSAAAYQGIVMVKK